MVQFLGTWEAGKKRGVFLILACIHKYIENFKEQYLSKVLFSNASNAPKRKSNILASRKARDTGVTNVECSRRG